MKDIDDFVQFTSDRLKLDGKQTNQFYHEFAKQYGGNMFYISKIEPKHREIRDSFNGRNYAELAKRYGLTERQIRNIVN